MTTDERVQKAKDLSAEITGYQQMIRELQQSRKTLGKEIIRMRGKIAELKDLRRKLIVEGMSR